MTLRLLPSLEVSYSCRSFHTCMILIIAKLIATCIIIQVVMPLAKAMAHVSIHHAEKDHKRELERTRSRVALTASGLSGPQNGQMTSSSICLTRALVGEFALLQLSLLRACIAAKLSTICFTFQDSPGRSRREASILSLRWS